MVSDHGILNVYNNVQRRKLYLGMPHYTIINNNNNKNNRTHF